MPSGPTVGVLHQIRLSDTMTLFQAMSTADTIQACNLDLVRREAGYGQLFSGTKIGAAASILSLLTNGIATLLTAYKAW